MISYNRLYQINKESEMGVKHWQLGQDLGLTLEGYVEMGQKEALKGKCILCGDIPEKAGILIADGTDAARQAIGTPNAKNARSHRFVFWAVCGSCQFDPDRDERVKKKVLQEIRGV